MHRNMIRACGLGATALLFTAMAGHSTLAENPAAAGPATKAAAASAPAMDPVIAKIRDEGLNHSHVDQTLDYLCNVIGQRLTASPSQARASEWTRDTLNQWGLSNAHIEPWGPFGRGWSLQEYSLSVVEPQIIMLKGYPKAWSPGLEQAVTADVVWLDAHNNADLAKYAGKLKGKVVLIGQVHPTEPHFDPQATRLTADELAKLENAPSELLQSATTGPTTRSGTALTSGATTKPATTQPGATSRPSAMSRNAAMLFAAEEFSFATKEGAIVIIDSSGHGDGGTIFVQGAQVPGPASRPTTRTASSGPTTTTAATRPKVYAVDAPVIPPQITLATEDFNRVVRMIALAQLVKVNVDLKVHFYPPAETNPANTVAEIPGSDLKDQIVMVGAHLDSWQSGEGATDNGVGSACAMESIRIIRALDLHPRRTIRVALWTGEEQGLLGSSAYVKEHFGILPEDNRPGAATRAATMPVKLALAQLVKKPEYEKLSVYFNLDNGSGKIRGVYTQGNSAAVPLFNAWLKPFTDLGAETVTLTNTGATDHISFDRIGLPGFQFIQDPIEYNTRTHHSNEDVFERIQMDDMKQASTIMAAFLWDAANMDARFPRKE